MKGTREACLDKTLSDYVPVLDLFPTASSKPHLVHKPRESCLGDELGRGGLEGNGPDFLLFFFFHAHA